MVMRCCRISWMRRRIFGRVNVREYDITEVLLEYLDDLEIVKIIEARKNEKEIPVNLDVL